MTDLLALAERCEAATGPDDALEWDIAKATGWNNQTWCPDFTASIDAALTLVPEGCGLHTASEYGEQRLPNSATFKLTGRHWARVYTPHHGSFENYAATLALAICAAALRARAAA